MKHVEAWTSEPIAVALESESLQDGSLSRSVRDSRQRNGKVTHHGSWLVTLSVYAVIGPNYSACSAELFSNATNSMFEAAIAAESSTGTWTTVWTDGS